MERTSGSLSARYVAKDRVFQLVGDGEQVILSVPASLQIPFFQLMFNSFLAILKLGMEYMNQEPVLDSTIIGQINEILKDESNTSTDSSTSESELHRDVPEDTGQG